MVNFTGDGGCTGGKDVWGFVWPNAANDETVDVPCPDGQGSLIKLSDKHESLFNTSLYMQKEPAECVLMECGRQPKSWSVTALALLKL